MPSTDDQICEPQGLSGRDAAPVSPVLATLERYWHELRGAGRLPMRTSVCATRIDDALPHAFVIERIAPGLARLRVCGQQLNGLLGMPGRGMPLSAFFAAPSQNLLGQRLEEAFSGPAIVEVPLRLSRGPLRKPTRGRMLILPLAAGDGRTTKAIGAIVLDGPAPAGVIKLDIVPTGHRVDVVSGHACLRVIAGGRAAAAPAKRPARSGPALSLVVDNEPSLV